MTLIEPERLYLATIAGDAAAVAREFALGLELDEFCTAANLDGTERDSWTDLMLTRMQAADRYILHAPFAELSPAAIDPLIAQVSRYRLEQAYALAAAHGIRRMVVHSGFIPRYHYSEWYLPRAAAFWREFVADKPAEFQLLVENVQDDDPVLLTESLAQAGDSRVRLCLDIGHAAVHSSHPLCGWIAATRPYLAHVHLHDNNCLEDRHLPLGQGDIPLKEAIVAIEKLCRPTYTIESMPSRPSLDWLTRTT